jgi:hypothetical protein
MYSFYSKNVFTNENVFFYNKNVFINENVLISNNEFLVKMYSFVKINLLVKIYSSNSEFPKIVRSTNQKYFPSDN